MAICTKCNICVIQKPSWCKECTYEYNKKYAKNNRDRIRKHKAKWRSKNIEKTKQMTHNWYVLNKSRKLESVRNYQVKKYSGWLSWADRKAIRSFYKNCPEGYEVDHIVPLNGKIVSGLHVPWNLQYMLPSENRKKSNKYE